MLNLYFFLVYFSKLFNKGISSIFFKNNLLFILIKPKYLLLFSEFLKKHTNFLFYQLLDIWGVDYLSRQKRFEVNYNLVSVTFNNFIIIRTQVGLNEGLESLVSLYKSAGWLERETWDMFGVFFFNNPDLRRILTDYGFEGFPLRKDFPLTGYSEIRYDYAEKRIVYEPLELTQEFRLPTYNLSWVYL